MIELESWAVAALAVVDFDNITPLLLRCYTSLESVIKKVELSSNELLEAHLYVGPEDVIRLHLLVLASLDQCDMLYEANCTELRANQMKSKTSTTYKKVIDQININAGVTDQKYTSSNTKSNYNISVNNNNYSKKNAKITNGESKNVDLSLTSSFALVEPGRWVSATTDVRYTGELRRDDRFTAFGFCGANHVKVVIVTVGEEPPLDALAPLCRTIYENAMWCMCNPFPLTVYNLERKGRQTSQMQKEEQQQQHQQIEENRDGSATKVKEEGKQVSEDKNISSGLISLETCNDEERYTWNSIVDVEGMYEDTWSLLPQLGHNTPRRHSTSLLSVSVTFNKQLHSLLSAFTVTSRSVIIEG